MFYILSIFGKYIYPSYEIVNLLINCLYLISNLLIHAIIKILTLLFSFISITLFSQPQIDSIPTGTLLFNDGDTIVFKLYNENDWLVNGFKMKGELWTIKSYPKSSLFHFDSDDMGKQFFYQYAPSKGNFMTLKEMQQFVSGKKTAKYEYSSRTEFFKAIFFGFALSMLDTYEFRNGFSGGFFQNSASWLTISSPMWSTFLIKIKQNKLNKSRNTIEIDDLKACYYQGYDNVFIKKNTKAVLGGSILGASIVVATKILLE